METKKLGTSKFSKHPGANTMYISIPADLVKEKHFPFKNGEIAKIRLDTEQQTITISKLE